MRNKQYYERTRQKFYKKSSFHELSDWTSNLDLHNQLHQKEQRIPLSPKKEIEKWAFINTARLQSALLTPHNNNKIERLSLSPVMLRFNAKHLTRNLQFSKDKLTNRSKEDSYLTHYRSFYR